MTRDEIISAMKDMALDVNSEEIKAHNTDLRLRQWTLAWGSKMMELIGALEENEKADVPDTDVGNIDEDVISRQEVLDILKEKWNMFSSADDAMQESIDTIESLPSVTPARPQNPERNRPESIKYCEECDHIEMCSWYPTDGCEWLKTDRYNAGYNAAKREIALSGEYERIYQRGFEAGRKSEWTAVADKEDSE